MKAAIKIAIALAALAPVAWTGIALYWRYRITGALREIEARQVWPTGMDGLDRPALNTLLDAGCRSIPHLLRVLETSRDDVLLANARHVISLHLSSRRVASEEESLAVLEALHESQFSSKDPPDQRRRNYERVVRLWEGQASRHNPWWRVWSSKCAP